MTFFGKAPDKQQMPSAKQALPGREDVMPVPDRHYVNGHPLQPPFPDGLQTIYLGLAVSGEPSDCSGNCPAFIQRLLAMPVATQPTRPMKKSAPEQPVTQKLSWWFMTLNR